MLNYISAFGRDAEFTVDYGGGISKNKIRLTVPGNPVDPFSLTENASDEEQGLANILLRIGQRPKWKYARGVNTIIYTLAKKGIPDMRTCASNCSPNMASNGAETGRTGRITSILRSPRP